MLIAFTTAIGWNTFHLARATLQRQVLTCDRARSLLIGAWRDFRFSRGQIAVFCLLFGIIGMWSIFARLQSPRDVDTNSVVVFSPYSAWQSLREVDPTPAKLMNFIGIRTYADLREVNVAEPPDGWDGKDWSKVKRVDLRGSNLAFADASGAFLANADLRGAILTGADFGSAQLSGADLSLAQLQGIDLRDAQLQGADLSYTQIQDAYLVGAQLQRADLSGALLPGADLGVTQLQSATLRGTQLQRANLINAKLQDADLWGAQLQGAKLGGTGLQRANLTNAQLRWADLRRAQLDGADLSAAQLHGVLLQGAQLPRTILQDVQLHGANLTDAQLQGANLTSAQLPGAILYKAKLQGAILWGVQLQGAGLWRAELQGANLTNARLQGADLRRTQLQGVMLRNAVLQGANLTDAQLQGAVLVGAQLQGTVLQRAQLQGADLRTAALWRVLVADAEWDLADLSGTDVEPIAGSKIDDVIKEATMGIPEEASRRASIERLKTALQSATRPERPDFPSEWRWQPNVMFKPGDPEPEPLDWGRPKWATEETYDVDLAILLSDLACRRDVPVAQTIGLAHRALYTDALEPRRVWPALFANQVIGADCPPAKQLPDDMRRRLDQLTARGNAAE